MSDLCCGSFTQEHEAQFNACDVRVTNGSKRSVGECYGIPQDIPQEIQQNSDSLGSAIQYTVGGRYYFASEFGGEGGREGGREGRN